MRLFDLGTDPSPPAQDDRLVEDFGSHNVFIQCLIGQTQAITDKGSTLKRVEDAAFASFINKRGLSYGKSTTRTQSSPGLGSLHERVDDVKGGHCPCPFGKQSTAGRRTTKSHSTKN
jgi:hypothetical protein